MKQQLPWVLGVDGGGTKTRCNASGLSGKLLGAVTTGPTNPNAGGLQQLIDRLASALEQLQKQTGLQMAHCRAAYLAMAGTEFDPGSREMFQRTVGQLGCTGRVVVEGDFRCAWAAAGAMDEGIVASCGTGSFVYGENRLGGRCLAGGWGPLFDDEGSCYDISREALRLAAQAADGRGESTRLVRVVLDFSGVSEMRMVSRWLRRQESPTAAIAGLAPHVFTAAHSGDSQAAAIIRRGAAAMTAGIQRVHSALFSGHEAPLYAVGSGFANQPEYLDIILAMAAEDGIPLVRRQPVLPVHAGAVLLALNLAGVPADEQLVETLAEEMPLH